MTIAPDVRTRVQLAEQINTEYQLYRENLRRGSVHALRCGVLLIEAKKMFGQHGKWLPWLRANCEVSERYAEKLMKIARDLPRVAEANPSRVTDLDDISVRRVLALLVEPREQDAQPQIDPTTNVRPTELLPIDDLKPHPRNYKQHPDDQIEHLMQSIAEHGFYRPVVVAGDNTILAGHGIREAAIKLGQTHIPVTRLDVDPDDPRALKILTSDNELGKRAESDDRALTEMLRDIKTAGDLLGTGFDAQQLAALVFVTRPESEIRDKNAAAAWVGMPEYEPMTEPIKLVLSFENEADRVRAMELLGITTIRKKSSGGAGSTTWSTWWPERPRADLSSLRFDVDASEVER